MKPKEQLTGGIYIHVPFCKKACNYCNFHFSTQVNHIDAFLSSLHHEIFLKSTLYQGFQIETIYFGGGTPSILKPKEISNIIEILLKNFKFNSDIEITIEANPDDISLEYLKEIRETPINRFSLGIQSFHEEDLVWMNRSHSSEQALLSLDRLQEIGYTNISCDLIFGYPLLSEKKLKQNLNLLLNYSIPHISAYTLTVEPKTALSVQMKKNFFAPLSNELIAGQFESVHHILTNAGYEHYEISNFAKNDALAKHNTSYWFGKPYLGFGPSAHSFINQKRLWNISNNVKYIEASKNGNTIHEEEEISPITAYNEFVLTRLRTKWGIEMKDLKSFPKNCTEYCLSKLEYFITQGYIQHENSRYNLTLDGMLLADYISAQLFIV